MKSGRLRWEPQKGEFKESFEYFIYLFFNLAMSHGMWDLSSPTRDGIGGPCIGSLES